MPDLLTPSSDLTNVPVGPVPSDVVSQRSIRQMQGSPQLHAGLRKQMIWRLHSQGMSVSEIAERLGLSRPTIYNDLERVMEEAKNRLKSCRDSTEESTAILLHRLEDLFRRCQADLQDQNLTPRQRVSLYEQTARILDRLAKFIPMAPDLNPAQPLQIQLTKIDNISPSVPIASPNPPCVPNS